MNEQIDVLALQATDNKGGLDRHKFAELIVRKCIYIVENTSDRYRKEYFANKIKQHFGVEE